MTRTTLAVILLLSAVFWLSPDTARAQCCSCPDTVEHTESREWDLNERYNDKEGTVPKINRHVTKQFKAHRKWYIEDFFANYLHPAMTRMTEQLSAVAMQQVAIFGTFLDAKHQMETQRLFQKIQARAHKDYHPSVGMCEFTSSVKSLAASERIGEVGSIAMSETLLDRHLGKAGNAAAAGESEDLRSRIEQYKTNYCNPADNNGNLSLLCDQGTPPHNRQNNDINFAKIIDSASETKINFTDSNITGDEKDVLALAKNLYGHKVFNRPPANSLKPNSSFPDDELRSNYVTAMQEAYMDMRAVIAKRSVAENSFNAIVGMKSEGTAGSKEFLKALLENLGISAAEANKILGENPSYDTQMDVLTKKIYQNPDFYTNLYDTPANVARKQVAMQAIGLMQKFDLFKSHLRSEASLSVLLEVAVARMQRKVEQESVDIKGDSTDADE